jgi:alkanesulfonate monooxygenase SsuD/methylene tetrahydromethanopterin reductase-like flavin-dependent oxidoreductase (luciferase family)
VIADTDEEAQAYMRDARKYFFNVLGGGPRIAANLVVKESRYYADAKRREGVGERRKELADAPIETHIEKGAILCGSPKTVVEQIKRIHGELGHGLMNITMKIGNIPDPVVRKGMQLFKDKVLPHVHNL